MKAIETINEKTAQAAWNANHFGDYRTGSCTAEYAAMVTEARKIAENQKKKVPEKYHKKIDNLLAYYERKLAANINQRNSIDASYPSILICGAGGFSNRKKEKQNSRRDSNMQEYTYIASILKKIKTVGTGGIMSGDADALEQLRNKLAKLEAHQEHMKQINAYYRKHNSFEGCPGISSTDAEKLAKYMTDFYQHQPFPAWELSNNSANIRRIRDRIETIEREKNRTAETITGDGWQLIEKPEIMRIQFIFDDKPDSDTRATLKRNGFRWAPSEGAWQRTLNNAGRYAAKDVMKQLPQAEPAEDTEAAPEELAPVEVPTPAEPAPEEITATPEDQTPEEPAAPAPVTVPEEIKRFEVGKTYQTRSICNNECIISITVTARTEKTITVIEHGETKRLKINDKSTEYHKAETVYPWGHYSMAPQIHADEIVNPEPPAPAPDDSPDHGSEPELTSYSKITIDYDYINNLIQSAKPENESPAEEITAPEAPEDQIPAEEITAAPEDQAAPAEDQTPTEPAEPAAPAPAPAEHERPKAKRRAAPDWVGKTMTAYPRKPKKPEWIGRKMVITIGERYARPAGA